MRPAIWFPGKTGDCVEVVLLHASNILPEPLLICKTAKTAHMAPIQVHCNNHQGKWT